MPTWHRRRDLDVRSAAHDRSDAPDGSDRHADPESEPSADVIDLRERHAGSPAPGRADPSPGEGPSRRSTPPPDEYVTYAPWFRQLHHLPEPTARPPGRPAHSQFTERLAAARAAAAARTENKETTAPDATTAEPTTRDDATAPPPEPLIARKTTTSDPTDAQPASTSGAAAEQPARPAEPEVPRAESAQGARADDQVTAPLTSDEDAAWHDLQEELTRAARDLRRRLDARPLDLSPLPLRPPAVESGSRPGPPPVRAATPAAGPPTLSRAAVPRLRLPRVRLPRLRLPRLRLPRLRLSRLRLPRLRLPRLRLPRLRLPRLRLPHLPRLAARMRRAWPRGWPEPSAVRGGAARASALVVRRLATHAWPVVLVAALVLLLLTTVVLRAVQAPDTPRPGDASMSSDDPVLAWLARNTGERTRIAAPEGLLPELGTALPGRELTGYSNGGAVDLVLMARSDGRVGDRPAPQLVRRTIPVGVFPSGYEIRQTIESASPAQARAERRTSGRRLVADTRLRLTPRAWAALTAGDVDPGLTGLLEQVVQNHTVDVTAFRRTAAERAAGAPARAMLVTAVDGQLAADRGDVAAMGAALFGSRGELAPDSLTVRTEPAPAGLLVRVLLPSSMP